MINSNRIRKAAAQAGLQFTAVVLLTVFIGTTLCLRGSFIARAGFWLLKGYLLERFFVFGLLVLAVTILTSLWAANEVLAKNSNVLITGLLYGLLVLSCCSLFLPLYVSVKCALAGKCFLHRFILKTYFEQVPYYLMLGLIPVCGLGVWFTGTFKRA